MGYLYLFIAVAAEVGGSTLLRMSNGFEKIELGIASLLVYGVSLGLLSMALKTVPLSVSYPTWAGIGTSLAVMVGLWHFGERLSSGQWVGLVFVTIGVVLLKVMANPDAVVG